MERMWVGVICNCVNGNVEDNGNNGIQCRGSESSILTYICLPSHKYIDRSLYLTLP